MGTGVYSNIHPQKYLILGVYQASWFQKIHWSFKILLYIPPWNQLKLTLYRPTEPICSDMLQQIDRMVIVMTYAGKIPLAGPNVEPMANDRES